MNLAVVWDLSNPVRSLVAGLYTKVPGKDKTTHRRIAETLDRARHLEVYCCLSSNHLGRPLDL